MNQDQTTRDDTTSPIDSISEANESSHDSELILKEEKVERIVDHALQKVMVQIRRESYSGPLPKPEHLKAYNEICPGAAQDILNEFKANGLHVRTCEQKALEGSISKVVRGQWLAVFLALICLGCAIACVALFDAHWVAGLLVVLTGTLVVPFLGFNPKDSKKEESEDIE